MSDPIEQLLGESRAAPTERLLSRIQRYVELETPSGNAERLNGLANLIARDLEEAGAAVDVHDAPGAGRNLVARAGGNADAEHILVLTHMDTVHRVGTLATQPFTVTAERASGPGIYDMKASIALIIEALLLLRRRNTKPARPVRVLVTCDEEVGSHSSRGLIEANAMGARATLVLEPCMPGGRCKTERKGVSSYRIDVFGRAAHAGVEPERGVSAIHELAKQVPQLLAAARPEAGTTVNVGVIHGGTAVNVVAAHADAEIDVRYTSSAEAQHVDEAMRALRSTSDARIEVRLQDRRPPLERSPGVVALYQEARLIAEQLGMQLGESATGGGSDGCFTAALGIPTLDGLGMDGGGAHAIDEHILIADLPFRLALLTTLLERL